MLTNKATLIIIMSVLIVFILVFTVVMILLLTVLRRREPIIRVVLPEQTEREPAAVEEQSAEQSEEESDESDNEAPEYITEGELRIRYDRSFKAKLCQLDEESKGWYSDIKNDMLSYPGVKSRVSWKRETFRVGRSVVARLAVRGKTLCLMLALDFEGLKGSRYIVEDVSFYASSADTPVLYRIKNERRAKYARDLFAEIMVKLGIQKDMLYSAQSFVEEYRDDYSLIQLGLVKRVALSASRTFSIEEGKLEEQLKEAASVQRDEASEE